MNRLRIWCENVPYDTLRRPALFTLLRQYDIAPLVAVRPDQGPGLADVLRHGRDAGVPVGIWPQLPDAQGRWAGAGNVTAYQQWVCQLIDSLLDSRLRPAELVVDLEPSLPRIGPWVSTHWRRQHHGARRHIPDLAKPRELSRRLTAWQTIGNRHLLAQQRFARLLNWLRDRHIPVSSTLVPLVLFDGQPTPSNGDPQKVETGGPWQLVLGTPVDGIAWPHANVMLYTSIIEGWARGLFARQDALSLLAAGCRATNERFGALGSVSLGVVGPGALGDEPTYRSAAELAQDVAVVRRLGIESLSLFDLAGVLSRPPAEAWLDALANTPPCCSLPPARWKVRAALALTRGLTALVTPLSKRITVRVAPAVKPGVSSKNADGTR